MRIDNLVSYYQSFEKDIEQLSRYINISEDNYSVYSVELTRLYLSICSEVDVALKVLCDTVSKDAPKGMRGYVEVIRDKLPQLIEAKVNFIDYRVSFLPWDELASNDNVQWWSDHNKVKHHRMEHYKKANLGNVLNAFCALYTINVYILFELKRQESPEWHYNFSQFLTQTMHLFKHVRMGGVPFAYVPLE
ncbi:hypothetical protein J7X22_001181 [Vibrio parahaemolyticus]|nr:hypothetical protein [Vibrio parahaemolyticus]